MKSRFGIFFIKVGEFSSNRALFRLGVLKYPVEMQRSDSKLMIMVTQRWKINFEEQISLGNGLREVQLSSKITNEEIHYWFQGEEKYFNVSIATSTGAISWIQISFRGFFLEWKPDRLIWGETNEFTNNAGKYPSSKTLNPKVQLDIEFINTIIGILTNARKIDLINQSVNVIKAELNKAS